MHPMARPPGTLLSAVRGLLRQGSIQRLRHPSTSATFCRQTVGRSPSRTTVRRPRPRWMMTMSAGAVGAAVLSYAPEEQSASQDAVDLLDDASSATETAHLKHLPLTSLIRGYLVFTITSSPLLVDMAPRIVDAMAYIKDTLPLGIGSLIHSTYLLVMRKTFFAQFVGGETVEECLPMVEDLYKRSSSVMLNWSAEAEEHQSESGCGGGTLVLQDGFRELTRAITLAGRFEPTTSLKQKPTMVAVKITGLVDNASIFARATEALASSTSYARGEMTLKTIAPPSPVLEDSDLEILQQIQEGLERICFIAEEHGVRLAFDAEQSWLQPCLDRMVGLLAARFNRGPLPIVYNTYQASLQGAEDAIKRDLAEAASKGYNLGVKLVRGAYIDSENAHARSKKVASPVWGSKNATDQCFDRCASLVLEDIAESIKRKTPGPSLMLATHNIPSIKSSVRYLQSQGLLHQGRGRTMHVDPDLAGRLVYAQLFGMADRLSHNMMSLFPRDVDQDSHPLNCIYVPYGRIDQALPYLVRRAQENKSILQGSSGGGHASGAVTQRRLFGREIRARLLGGV